MSKQPKSHLKRLTTFDYINSAILLLVAVCCMYPFLYVFFVATTDGTYLAGGGSLFLVTNYGDYSTEAMPNLTALLAECGLRAKLARRGGCHIVYFKESEQIEDCLTLIGATNASLELMGVKMVKNIRNNANRVANCETANIDKTVAAAAVQVEAVHKICRCGGLDKLPEELRELAALRLENPDMSLRELGEELDPPLSRSGVNHRLQRILAFAADLPGS